MGETVAMCQRVETKVSGLPDDFVQLTYERRLLRRKRLQTVSGEAILVDLEQVRSLDEGNGLVLDDGRIVGVVAEEEGLVAVTGPDLMRYAWHIGNRHTPCQIEADRLLIAQDHVLEAMLAGLGADCAHVTEPFRPEGGAYGHGRTFGHSHGAGEHSHSHD